MHTAQRSANLQHPHHTTPVLFLVSHSSDACGRLSLLDIQSVRRYVGAEHGSYTFVVHATDREMLLRADSANDESRWIRGLTLQTDLVHGGTFQGPPSAKNRWDRDAREGDTRTSKREKTCCCLVGPDAIEGNTDTSK